LGSILAEFEQKNVVTSRWKPGDQQYEEIKTSIVIKEKKEQIRTSLWSSLVK